MLAANQCNTIVVEVRDVYGVSKVYPVCGEAQIFAAIAGTKTLRPEDIKHIQMLGYEIQIKQPEVNI
jgi:hypothetical protein